MAMRKGHLAPPLQTFLRVWNSSLVLQLISVNKENFTFVLQVKYGHTQGAPGTTPEKNFWVLAFNLWFSINFNQHTKDTLVVHREVL
jgi:hypothetical protein